MTTTNDRPGEMLAYFVAGPQHGATMWLPEGTSSYRFPIASQLAAVDTAAREGLRTDASELRYSVYERTKQCSNHYLRGCYIFEWMGR